MNKEKNNLVRVLDCTLRDGGYCNSWQFGKANISKVMKYLVEAKVEIVECGFISDKGDFDGNKSVFNTFYQANTFKPKTVGETLFVAMINYGEYDIKNVPDCDESTIQGIRLAFHKKDVKQAISYCKQLKNKGYKVFVQPMVSMNYTEEEFIDLINMTNSFSPFAFYIVDTFGSFKVSDLQRRFLLVEKYLDMDISIGFHTHNNSQLAYSNAQAFVSYPTIHDRIVDCSILGMGRGAGNLNTELFLEFLNDYKEKDYLISPILTAIDEVIGYFYDKHYWGYSLPNYLSAKYNCHPNYANYLSAKHTLTIDNINDIFAMFDENKKNNYDELYVESVYFEYMKRGQDNETQISNFKKEIIGKEVLIIAPGKSFIEELDRIREYVNEHKPIIICVNFIQSLLNVDYVFVSNLRRYKNIPSIYFDKLIATSNLKAERAHIIVKYEELLNDEEGVRDNSALMLIKLLMNCDVRKITLAGLDGYSYDMEENFISRGMDFSITKRNAEIINNGIETVLDMYAKKVKIEFLTKEKRVKMGRK